MAHADLADRDALLFDDLEGWEERNAAEHRVAGLMVAVGKHPELAAIQSAGHRLIDFAEMRLRAEVALLLRGWTAAGAGVGAGMGTSAGANMGAGEEVGMGAGAGAPVLICDPAAAPALLMGLRAGLGMDLASVPYATPSALPGSRLKRALARPPMRALAARSQLAGVRVAAVAAGKLALALAALPRAELRAIGVAAMPFPGLDYGNSAVLALRRGLPLLPGYGPTRSSPGPAVRLPDRLELVEEPALDRALTVLVGRLLSGVAPEHAHAVAALDGLERVRSLQALLLPSAAYGASRLLIEWAHERGVRVGAMQHGIYAFRDYDGGDRRADVLFGWGDGTAEQIECWAAPRPSVLPVGVPGTPPAPPRPPLARPRRALIATSSTVDVPLSPVAFCEAFIEAIAPGLRRLAAAGVQLSLRPHPNEDPRRYRRLLDALDLDVALAARGPFREAVAGADILISSASSVAFEAAALGVPVLLWLGSAPEWVRREHLVVPWVQGVPGTFQDAGEFRSLIDALLERSAEGLGVARELSRVLARYAQPFDGGAFLEGLRALSA
jgi:hypothetical protein